MADETTQLEREQVISLIGRYAKEFAGLARQRGCTSLSYLLQLAAEQAEKDLMKARESGESGGAATHGAT